MPYASSSFSRPRLGSRPYHRAVEILTPLFHPRRRRPSNAPARPSRKRTPRSPRSSKRPKPRRGPRARSRRRCVSLLLLVPVLSSAAGREAVLMAAGFATGDTGQVGSPRGRQARPLPLNAFQCLRDEGARTGIGPCRSAISLILRDRLPPHDSFRCDLSECRLDVRRFWSCRFVGNRVRVPPVSVGR